jgi:alkylated DNA nucleotide flippase Atl1
MGTGIFAAIAARAAEEDAADGEQDITPWWRTVKVGGALNEKYPGGAAAQAAHLKAEGHEVVSGKDGRPKKVKDFEQKLVEG